MGHTGQSQPARSGDIGTGRPRYWRVTSRRPARCVGDACPSCSAPMFCIAGGRAAGVHRSIKNLFNTAVCPQWFCAPQLKLRTKLRASGAVRRDAARRGASFSVWRWRRGGASVHGSTLRARRNRGPRARRPTMSVLNVINSRWHLCALVEFESHRHRETDSAGRLFRVFLSCQTIYGPRLLRLYRPSTLGSSGSFCAQGTPSYFQQEHARSPTRHNQWRAGRSEIPSHRVEFKLPSKLTPSIFRSPPRLAALGREGGAAWCLTRRRSDRVVILAGPLHGRRMLVFRQSARRH